MSRDGLCAATVISMNSPVRGNTKPMRNFWRRIWHARLTWKVTLVMCACDVGLFFLCFQITSAFIRDLAIATVGLTSFGLMAKMMENDQRHQTGDVSDFPWWARWLLLSALVLVQAIGWAVTDAPWTLVISAVALITFVVLRRAVERAKYRERERRAM